MTMVVVAVQCDLLEHQVVYLMEELCKRVCIKDQCDGTQYTCMCPITLVRCISIKSLCTFICKPKHSSSSSKRSFFSMVEHPTSEPDGDCSRCVSLVDHRPVRLRGSDVRIENWVCSQQCENSVNTYTMKQSMVNRHCHLVKTDMHC